MLKALSYGRGVKDLGRIILDHLVLGEHKTTVESAAKMMAWILRNFKMREARPVITLFKTLDLL